MLLPRYETISHFSDPHRVAQILNLHSEIRHRLLRETWLAEWPAFRGLVDKEPPEGVTPCWFYPFLSFASETGTSNGADHLLPAAASVYCQYCGIHLIDDLLDEDPTGIYRTYGAGSVANLASAFQGLAVQVMGESTLGPSSKVLATQWMAEAQVATSHGQYLDSLDADDELGYWRVAAAKTPPLFSFALALGSLFSTADPDRHKMYQNFGKLVGLLIQVGDDILDALATPARADWSRQGTNLAILYARTSDHQERDRFCQLIPEVGSPERLREAQEILVRCGAVSQCSYQMVKLAREALSELSLIDPADRRPLEDQIRRMLGPLVETLLRAGISSPEKLIFGSEPVTCSV